MTTGTFKSNLAQNFGLAEIVPNSLNILFLLASEASLMDVQSQN